MGVTVFLRSGDSTYITVDLDVAIMSDLVRDQIPPVSKVSDGLVILVRNVGHDALEKLMAWCKHHHDLRFQSPLLMGAGLARPYLSALGEEVNLHLSSWDFDFFKGMDILQFDEVLWAGHYTEVKVFCDLIAVVCGVGGGYMQDSPRMIQEKLLKALENLPALNGEPDYLTQGAGAGDGGEEAAGPGTGAPAGGPIDADLEDGEIEGIE